MRAIQLSFLYSIKIFSRVKSAIFFSWLFPVILLLIFGTIFGGGQADYIYFLLAGLITMNIGSIGLFAVGPIIFEYHKSRAIKLLNVFPISIINYFIGFTVSRVFLLLLSTAFLITIAFFVFDFQPDIAFCLRLVIGSLLGVLMFAFLGLIVILIIWKQSNGESALYQSVMKIFFYALMFLSDIFYPISSMKLEFAKVIQFNPFSPLLTYFRDGGIVYVGILSAIVVLLGAIFLVLFKRTSFQR